MAYGLLYRLPTTKYGSLKNRDYVNHLEHKLFSSLLSSNWGNTGIGLNLKRLTLFRFLRFFMEKTPAKISDALRSASITSIFSNLSFQTGTVAGNPSCLIP